MEQVQVVRASLASMIVHVARVIGAEHTKKLMSDLILHRMSMPDSEMVALNDVEGIFDYNENHYQIMIDLYHFMVTSILFDSIFCITVS